VVFSVSVCFPRTDLPLLIERMRAFDVTDWAKECREAQGQFL